VSSLLYLQTEKLLICSSWDSTIRIFDEENNEESNEIKVLYGGHEDSEILCLAYSSQY